MRSAHRGAPGLRGGDDLYRHSIDQNRTDHDVGGFGQELVRVGLTASMYRSVPNMNRGSIVSSFATGGIEGAVIQAKAAAGKSVGPRR
jgi:hypothetical protein